jgi:hypothetical protein
MKDVSPKAALLLFLGVSACGGGNPDPVPTPTAVVPSPTPTPQPTPAPSGTIEAHLNVTPTSGSVPLPIEANLCQSVHPANVSLTYSFDYGDSTTPVTDTFCRLNYTYQKVGSFRVLGCVIDDTPSHSRVCDNPKTINVTAADLGGKIAVNTAKGCMIDVTVDVGALAGNGLRVLSVSQVRVIFRRTTSSPAVSATRDGTSSRWVVQNYNIAPLGAGSMSVSVEAIDSGQTVGNGSRTGINPSCP